MKTIKEVQKEILSLQKRNKEEDCERSETKKNTKRIELLKLVAIYLSFSPTQDYCESERSRLHRIIDAALDSWRQEYQRHREAWDKLPMASITKHKNQFLKDVDLALMRSQIRTLDYILA